jgi:phosphohistidine phosphatase SixA
MRIRLMLVAAVALCCAPRVAGQPVSGQTLVEGLRHGGYVLVMRHAHAPEQPPLPDQADPANRNRERQLDDAGRSAALAMGAALRSLQLPIGAVWSSPTYRARETAQLAGLPAPKIASELGDGGHSMQAATAGQAKWLDELANRPPRAATDTVIVTQYPNIKAAFGDEAADMKDGEALVLKPAKDGPRLVARVTMDQWPQLAASAR